VVLILLVLYIRWRKRQTLPQDPAGVQAPNTDGLLPVYQPRDGQGSYVPFQNDDTDESPRSSILREYEMRPLPQTPPSSSTTINRGEV